MSLGDALQDFPALYDAKDDGNDRNDQQHMYNASNVESKETKCPSDN